MKWLKILTPLLALHLIAWIASHIYFTNNKQEVLLVVDTSYSMKEKSGRVLQWIDQYEVSDRYKSVTIGTDLSLIHI